MTNIDDDVPPLEDMSDVIASLRGNAHVGTANSGSSSGVRYAVGVDPATAPLSTQSQHVTAPAPQKSASSAPPASQTKPSSNGFGGMKKGFFDSKPKAAKASSPGVTSASGGAAVNASAGTKTAWAPSSQPPLAVDDDVIEILTPKAAKDEALRLAEVQEAMKTSVPGMGIGGNEWMNASLMARIAKRPNLAKRLMDPRYAAALGEMQKNPKECVERLKDDPEMDAFIREFAEVMGSHFEVLANEQEEAARKKAEEDARAAEAQRQAALADPNVKKILENAELKALLTDPDVVALIESLRTNPDAAQDALRKGGPAMGAKIKKLVESGLLSVQ